jgi:hypothetical protein
MDGPSACPYSGRSGYLRFADTAGILITAAHTVLAARIRTLPALLLLLPSVVVSAALLLVTLAATLLAGAPLSAARFAGSGVRILLRSDRG